MRTVALKVIGCLFTVATQLACSPPADSLSAESLPAESQPNERLPTDRGGKVCWPGLARAEALNRLDPIPVGCALVNCCPGCERRESLDWAIELAGGPIKSAHLRFDNLTPEELARLTLENVKKTNDGRLLIGKGKARILGLPNRTSGVPPVGRFNLNYDENWASQVVAQSSAKERSLDASRQDDVRMIIEQRSGTVVVNEYVAKYELRFCGPHQSDKIKLMNNSGGDQAVVFYGGLTEDGVCLESEATRGDQEITLGNLVPSDSCPSEISVFSDENVMKFKENINDWTDAAIDTLPLPLRPGLLTAPVAVWLVGGGSTNDAKFLADSGLDDANLIYSVNNGGIGFTTNSSRSDTFRKPEVVQLTAGVCSGVATLTTSAFFKPEQINVYVIDKPITGENCALNPNVIFIGTEAYPSTLAHELGHAFSLKHSDTILGLTTQNIMFPDEPLRSFLSEGQLFRANVHCGSMLNVNRVRGVSEPKRNCTSTLRSQTCGDFETRCPAMSPDILPN